MEHSMKNAEWLELLLKFIAFDDKNCVNSNTIRCGNTIVDILHQLKESELDNDDLDSLEMIFTIDNPQYVLFWLSILVDKFRCEKLYFKMLDYVLEKRNCFSIDTQFYLFLQITTISFINSYIMPLSVSLKWDNWLFEIISYYRSEFKDLLCPIAAEARNRNLVFVVTNQMLDIQHSPTAVALGWCKYLMDNGKIVLLINTAEVLSQVGYIEFKNHSPYYLNQYSELSSFNYEGVDIPFFQCPPSMPCMEILSALLNVVRDKKPGFIISIGDIIFSDLADKISPVYSISLTADMPHKYTKYRSQYRELTDKDDQWLKHTGFNSSSLIKTSFAFKLPFQKSHISRSKLGIPEDRFCLTVVGTRLNKELSDEYLSVIRDVIISNNCFFCIVGNLNYELTLNNYPEFKENSCWIPVSDDLLSIMEICDLYVNPRRAGGGTSVIFAMHHGKPVVSIDYGDVSMNCGKEFCVSDYQEMKEKIIMLKNNHEYYSKLSLLATKRAEELTDLQKIMADQINEIIKLEGL